jgi:hypothetical protein
MKAPAPPIPHERLAVLLEEQNKKAVGYLSDELSQDQDDNLARYLGMPYGDEEEGSSNAMSFDVAEVVDWALPDLLEPFISGERCVEFEPTKKGDEEWCEQATDFIEHLFHVENNGVMILHDVAKTAFIQKIGCTKTRWKEEDREEQCTLQGLSIINLAELQADKTVTIEDVVAEPVSPELMEMAGQAFVDGQSYTVTMTRRERRGRPEVMVIPPEELKVSARAANLDKIPYICHESRKTRGDLIEEGFDRAMVMGLRSDKAGNSERSDTRFVGESSRTDSASGNLADEVLLHEEYIRADLDGKVVTLQAFRVGKTILSSEIVSEHCFDVWTADRIPSRLIGLALADKAKQTQRVKTVLLRQFLDNIYLANNPRIEVPEQAVGENTYDDLLTYRIGGLIRTKQGGMLNPIQLPDRSSSALQAIVYMDSVREQQTGIVKNGMAVASEAIDPKSATESRNKDRNEQVRKRLMARMFAETFLVPLFRRILRLVVKYQDFERIIRMRGKWVPMDPRTWNADLVAKVSVGLGHSNRDEMLMAGQVIMGLQVQALQMGFATPKHLYKTASKMVEALGLRFPDQYFLDPDTPEGQQAMQKMQQGQQDPKMLEVQGKLQAKQLEMQMDAQHAQIKAQQEIQLEMLKLEAKAAVEQKRADFDLRGRMIQIQHEYDLGLKELMAEMQLKRVQMAMEVQLEARNQDHQAEIGHAKVKALSDQRRAGSDVRFGGKIG